MQDSGIDHGAFNIARHDEALEEVRNQMIRDRIAGMQPFDLDFIECIETHRRMVTRACWHSDSE